MSLPPFKPADGRRIIPIRSDDTGPQADATALTRREALKLLAVSMAAAASGCAKPPDEAVQAYMSGPEHTPGEGAVYYASAHVREGYAHAVLIGTQDGRPTKIEGNPRHLGSLGGTDVFAQASVLGLWDPDRSKAVARRIEGPVPTEPRPDEPPMATASWGDFERAWVPLQAALNASRGKGLYVLTGAFSSPTLLDQIQSLQRPLPEMAWVGLTTPSETNALEGAKLAFGRVLQPLYRLDRASFVLSLGEDAFAGGPGSVRHAHEWSKRRHPMDGQRPVLFVAETAPSLMGARADRRLALNPPDLEAMVWRLVARLASSSAGLPPEAPAGSSQALAAFEDAVLGRLRAAGPDALIMAGPALSPQAHAAVHWINRSLGATGKTLEWIEPVLTLPPKSPRDLMQDIDEGKVQSLWMIGCNPVYQLPDGQRLAQALRRIPFSVHLGPHLDETAAHCAWHLPESHGYEQWSDARSADGTVTIIQPAMAALYDTRSAHEVLALLAGSGMRNGRNIVQAFWREHRQQKDAQTSDFDAFWRKALANGCIEGTQHSPAQALPPGRLPAWPDRPALASGQVYLNIAPDPAVREGAYANNAWLQEWPRPLTQLTWGHALYLGPETARALKVDTGELVDIRGADGVVLRCPVWVWQGHAEGSATLHSGYGRWRAGHIGNGIGVNANLLRATTADHPVVSLTKTGRQHAFAVRQLEMSQHGRDLARVVRPGHAASQESPQPSLYPDHANPVHAWAMVVDLDACIGCGACTIACQAENNIPTVGPEEVAKGRIMHWLRVDAYPQPSGEALFQPVPCMHCENAPCELVCPVGATLHDSEGLNAQVYNRCIGTRFCSNNCPYKVRRFNFLQYSDVSTESLHGLRNPDVTVRERGVMEKCTYCVQRISRARRHSQTTGEPLRDGDVVTACQAVCPTHAITFGDLNMADSQVNHARRSERHYALLAELNTRPRTTYLARRASELDDEA